MTTPLESLRKLPFGTATEIINQLEADGLVILPRAIEAENRKLKILIAQLDSALRGAAASIPDWAVKPDPALHK